MDHYMLDLRKLHFHGIMYPFRDGMAFVKAFIAVDAYLDICIYLIPEKPCAQKVDTYYTVLSGNKAADRFLCFLITAPVGHFPDRLLADRRFRAADLYEGGP